MNEAEQRSAPRRRWIVIVAAAAVGLASGWAAYTAGRYFAPSERAGTILAEPHDVADLRLRLAPGGSEVTLGEVAGEADWTLVFFGFVDCPDVCPMTMARLADIVRDLGDPAGVQVTMITVDPENDDPERLGAFVTGFHPDFRGLTGDNEQIAVAASRFFVGYNKVQHDLHGEMVIHTESVALVDSHGRLRAVYGQGSLAGLRSDLADVLRRGRL